MPVLPLVASISVSPGLMSPRSSARVSIDMAARSLTEPAGLLPSSLPRMTLLRAAASAPGRRVSCTSGVLPIVSCKVLYAIVFYSSISKTIILIRVQDERMQRPGHEQIAEPLTVDAEHVGDLAGLHEAAAAVQPQRRRVGRQDLEVDPVQ